MVYVSSNQVWLSRSTDGTNWEKEILISDNGNVQPVIPSITILGSTKLILFGKIIYWIW